MAKIVVEVPDNVARNFKGLNVVKYEDILEYDKNLKYNFGDEKVSFEELSSFLDKAITSKTGVC